MSSRNRTKKKFADYVLQFEAGVSIAIIEAKDNNHTVGRGLQQALGYAGILDVPCAFSSNGDAFASHNKVPDPGEDIECEFSLESFPTPEEVWKRYKKHRNIKDDEEELVLEPYHLDAYGKEPRYYQSEAINRTLEAIAGGQKRLLLVMATGTGKTYTVFQIIWRLWKAKKAKRTLFLVDRNILADQTLVNDFKPFGSVMTKVKNRKIRPSYEVYLGLYQALTGPDEEDKIFKTISLPSSSTSSSSTSVTAAARRRTPLARNPRLLLERHPNRSDGDAQRDQIRLQLHLLRAYVTPTRSSRASKTAF